MSKSPEIVTTLGELVEAEVALKKVTAVRFDKEGGATLRYHVTKLARLVAQETKHFWDDRNGLIEQYGMERKTTGAERARTGQDTITEVARGTAVWKLFEAALKELTAVTVTIPWGPLTAAQMEPYPDVTGADMLALGPLFELDPATEGEATCAA